MTSGIYAITNTKTGSRYVGSAINISSRWKSHRSALRNHKKSPPKLQAAWDKYGEAMFTFSILEECPKSNLLAREQYYIDTVKPKYNTRQEASSNQGIKWSEETNKRKGRARVIYTVDGVTGNLPALCRHFGVVAKDTARFRIKRGMSVRDALLTPIVPKDEIGRRTAATHKRNGTHPSSRIETAFGATANLKTLHKKFGKVTEFVFKRRVQLGWNIEDALTKPTRGAS